MNQYRVGIIGCGAVTAKYHLPSLAGMQGLHVTALADPCLERARDLAKVHGVHHVAVDYRDILNHVDALVLALPHHLHASIGVDVLRAGKHVLMEKPLATTVAACDELINAARQADRILAVGQVRRYIPAIQATREWLASDILGDLEKFDVEEGGVYRWPVASDFFFRPEMSGGGVLMDTGAHVLDTLYWWLGELGVTAYVDDACGGVEADCEMTLRARRGSVGTMKLSRLRGLRNSSQFYGSRAMLEVFPLNNRVRIVPRDSTWGMSGAYEIVNETPMPDLRDLFAQQAKDWMLAMRGAESGIARAEDVRESIQLIQDGYAQRVSRASCWDQPCPEAVTS